VSCSFIVSTVLVSTDGPTAPGDLTVNSWAAQEAPEKRPQPATCQQNFVKLGLMTCPSGCQNPPAKMAAFSEFSSILREPQCKRGFTMFDVPSDRQ
jgi:hypothetical protein